MFESSKTSLEQHYTFVAYEDKDVDFVHMLKIGEFKEVFGGVCY